MRKHVQRFGNLLVIGLLRSPLHRPASGSLLLITYRGRRSGRRFTIPVMYAERDGALTIFVGYPERKRWWRNLRVGSEVQVRLRGRRLRGQAEVFEDVAGLESYLDRYPRARMGHRGRRLAHLCSHHRADAERITPRVERSTPVRPDGSPPGSCWPPPVLAG
jgi:hypothetical protein